MLIFMTFKIRRIILKTLEQAIKLLSLEEYDCREVEGHECGRNRIFFAVRMVQAKSF